MRRNLTKKEIIRKKKEIRKVFTSSYICRCQGAKLVILENGLAWNRILITLVRKFGNSVERNRERRVVKEIYRNMKNLVKPGHDLIVICYPGDYGYEGRRRQIIKLFQNARLLKDS